MSAKRYARLPIDTGDRLAAAKLSDGAQLLFFKLLVHPGKRTIPGLIETGVLGLAERLFKDLDRATSVTKAESFLDELVRSGLVLVDEVNLLIYVKGAATEDGPTTPQSVIAMARQLGDLRQSEITKALDLEIPATFRGQKQESAMRSAWQKERVGKFVENGPHIDASGEDEVEENTSDPTLESTLDVTHEPTLDVTQSFSGTVFRSPSSVVPITAAAAAEPSTESVDIDREGRFKAAWLMLVPPFAAAAAADITKARNELSNEEFGDLVRQLARSKFALLEHGLNVRPTLSKLLKDPTLRERITLGEFASSRSWWVCPTCETDHNPLNECPPQCRGCYRFHAADTYCQQLRNLQASEVVVTPEPTVESQPWTPPPANIERIRLALADSLGRQPHRTQRTGTKE